MPLHLAWHLKPRQNQAPAQRRNRAKGQELMNDDWLERMNQALRPTEMNHCIAGRRKHDVFVVGVPRSGTTLATQLLASFAEVGYINNLIARFWSAPATGALLSKSLGIEPSFSGHSDYGRTHRVDEPHEFGRFWRDRLGHVEVTQPYRDHRVDWDTLLDELDRIGQVFGQPVLYKSFHLAWHM